MCRCRCPLWVAAAWIAAFGGFVLLYGPLLAAQKPSWERRT